MPELPGLRRAAHDSPHAAPHERAARLGQRRRRSPAGRAPRASIRMRTCSTSSSRQRALNFPPGTQLVVQQHRLQPRRDHRLARQRRCRSPTSRRQRIFEPLGHDAHLLARRLHAASSRAARSPTARQGDGSHLDMPFENVHGNGGLLTTVGDLLKWNENFATPVVGDAASRRVQRPGSPTAAHDTPWALLRATRASARWITAATAAAIAPIWHAIRTAGVGRRALQRQQRRRDGVRERRRGVVPDRSCQFPGAASGACADRSGSRGNSWACIGRASRLAS